MGFPLRAEFANENHGEDGRSKHCIDQCTDQNAIFLGAYHHRLHSKHKKGNFMMRQKRELQDALEMLDLEWRKDEDTRTQCNQLNTRALYQENAFSTNGPAQVIQRMQRKALTKLLSTDDPLLLLERKVRVEIGITWFLDPDILSHPKGGFVRILLESLLCEERFGNTRTRTTDSLTKCMELRTGWTIASSSSSWIFLRKRCLDREQDLITLIQE